MVFRQTVRTMCVTAIIGLALGAAANAQRAPTLNSMMIAKELVELTGKGRMFDPVIVGVIEHHKNLLLQTNPNLSRDLSEIVQKLHTEMAPRRAELENEIVKAYAQHFTEQELRDALAFYKSPLGRKILAEEPKAVDDSMKRADEWTSKFAEEIVGKLRGELRKKGHNPI